MSEPTSEPTSEPMASRPVTSESVAGQGRILSITEAAKELGISIKTVQRRLDSGELVTVQVAGKRCVRLDASAVNGDASQDTLDSDAFNVSRVASEVKERDIEGGTTLARLPDPRGLALIAAVARETVAAMEQRRPQVDIEQKLMLRIEEAAALSGLSKGAIEAAIKDGNLTAHKGPWRGRRVKRSELEEWINKL